LGTGASVSQFAVLHRPKMLDTGYLYAIATHGQKHSRQKGWLFWGESNGILAIPLDMVHVPDFAFNQWTTPGKALHY